jgi:hypothetical protein
LYFAVICVVCALPCAAAESIVGLLACRALTDPGARLECFDRETAALASAPVASSAAAPPAPALDAQQAFGVSGSAIAATEAAAARAPKASKIDARVVALALTGNGRTLFTLDNTQVWRQIESERDMLAMLGDAVTISRGAFGSYWLQLKSGRGCKVTRVR